jgi:hypothetical protein
VRRRGGAATKKSATKITKITKDSEASWPIFSHAAYSALLTSAQLTTFHHALM